MTDPLHLGVVAPVAPESAAAIVAAEAFRRELQHGLGPVVVDFRTTLEPARPLDPSPWRDLRTADWARTVHAVVIDERITHDVSVERACRGVDVIVTTDVLSRPDELAAILPRRLDAATLDSRRRMLVHLGVLPAGDEPLDRVPDVMPLRATDLYLIAQRLRASDDPVLVALAGGHVPDARRSIDAVVTQLGELLADTVVESVAQLRDRADAAESALADERVRHHAELRGVLDRLEHAEQVLEASRRPHLGTPIA